MNSNHLEAQTEAVIRENSSASQEITEITVDFEDSCVIRKGKGNRLRPSYYFGMLILVFVFAIVVHEMFRNSALMSNEFHSLMKLSHYNLGRGRTANGRNTKGTKSGCGQPITASTSESKKQKSQEDESGKWPWTTEAPATHTSAPAANRV